MGNNLSFCPARSVTPIDTTNPMDTEQYPLPRSDTKPMDTEQPRPRPRPRPDTEQSLSQRPQLPKIQFRVLIIGRANAGKTTILQRVCDTTNSPTIYRNHGSRRESSVRHGGLLAVLV